MWIYTCMWYYKCVTPCAHLAGDGCERYWFTRTCVLLYILMQVWTDKWKTLVCEVERWLIHYRCSYPVFAAVFFPETSASRWCHFSMTVVCCLLLQHLGWRWLHACKLEQLPRHVCHYVVWIQIHIMLTYFIDTKYSTLFLLFCIEWSPLACNIFVNLSFQ